jgi:hypothetical protein
VATVNWFSRLLASRAATPPDPAPASIVERDPVVAALIERCSRLTGVEGAALHGALRAVERDPHRLARIREGRRLAVEALPEAVREAESAAEYAYCALLEIPSDGMLYAYHDPAYGPTIAAIWAHAAAVAARDVLPVDVADVMSGPWREAVAPEPTNAPWAEAGQVMEG